MTDGTTQPVLSEDLRAQVALRQVMPVHRNRCRPTIELVGRRTMQTTGDAVGMVGSALTKACPAEGIAPNSLWGA